MNYFFPGLGQGLRLATWSPSTHVCRRRRRRRRRRRSRPDSISRERRTVVMHVLSGELVEILRYVSVRPVGLNLC